MYRTSEKYVIRFWQNSIHYGEISGELSPYLAILLNISCRLSDYLILGNMDGQVALETENV